MQQNASPGEAPGRQDVEDWLDTYSVPPARPQLRRRILARAAAGTRPADSGSWLAPLGGWRLAGPALAASLLLGVWTDRQFGIEYESAGAGASVWTLALLPAPQDGDEG